MRQAILVIVLVAASFLGGAFVNGPGLNWAQTRVLRSLGLSDPSEIASVDLKATASAETGSDGSTSAKPDSEPVAPVPSLIAEGESYQQDRSGRRSMPKPESKPESCVTDGTSLRSRTSSSSSATSTVATAASSSSSQTAPLDVSITPVAGTSQPESPRELSVRSSPPDRNLAPAVLDSLAALLPTAPARSADSSPLSSPSSSAPNAPKSVVDEGDDWAVLQRKMQTLGVGRFNIEGQPGGRVVFSCLIPLAGRQAVAQRFEAEGDDVVSAAQATIRRVALWQATQPQSP